MPARRHPPRPLDLDPGHHSSLRSFYPGLSYDNVHRFSEGRAQSNNLYPVSPVDGTARLPTSGLTPHVIDIARPQTDRSAICSLRTVRDDRPTLPSRRDSLYLRKDAWVRHRHGRALPFPFRLHSPVLQSIIGGMIFVASLTAYATLRQAPSMNTTLQVTLIGLFIVSSILTVHGIVRVFLPRKRYIVLHGKHYPVRQQRHHRRRHHPAQTPPYRAPQSVFDQLPPDDAVYSPITPVRVHLLRDEEAVMGDKDHDNIEIPEGSAGMPTPPPPAYGLWRCSVRADPNLLHWEQREDGKDVSASVQEMVQRDSSPRTSAAAAMVARPPSYHSDRGVELREDDTGTSMEPGAFVEAVADIGRLERSAQRLVR